MTTTLLAVTGLSPAVVTESIWALAMQRHRIVPQRVRFITTATGARKIEEGLFTSRPDLEGRTVWDALRTAVGAATAELVADVPCIISAPDESTGRMQPLADIVTPDDNEQAATIIFDEVSRITRDKDQRLVASIAGGRKTMGALVHAAVSLTGRESDLLTHVLVDPPFDTIPDFFFPGQPGTELTDSDGTALATDNVKVHLADIPFVPLRNRFRELDDFPGSFLGLRSELSHILRDDAERPAIEIVINHQKESLGVAGHAYSCRARALAILEFVLRKNEEGAVPRDQKEAAEQFSQWYAINRKRLGAFDETGGFDESDIKRELSHVRTRLDRQRAPWHPAKGTLHQLPFRLVVD